MVQDLQGVTRKILLVDDEPSLQKMLTHALEREGFQVQVAGDGEAALEAFKTFEPHLIVLDIMLPKLDGTEVIRRIRAQSDVPVIMLTARDDEMSVVVGLEVGADDYITKPFSHRELVSRVRATLRRRRIDARASSKQERLEFPGLAIDLARRQVVAQGTPVDLTAAQFDILLLLASHPGWVYSRGQVMETVWGTEFSGDSRAADMQIRNIREKIEPDPKNPRYVLTVRGMGYKFAEI
jgi:DNA-binding response OmpR family regulator